MFIRCVNFWTSKRLFGEVLSQSEVFGSKRALLPLLCFVSVFLGVGYYYQLQGVDFAFYQLPAPVAILPAIVLAMILAKQSINQSIAQFVAGAGHSNIMTMCLIYLLAGAFSSVAKVTGGVDATVALGLSLIPGEWLLPGLFLLSAFVATAMGTSMGTLATMAPIGLGICQATDISEPLMAGVLLSGAMFGDNLSIISDTTIASTRTQGANMSDKFKANLKYAVPAALLTLLLLSMQSHQQGVLPQGEANFFLAIPYILILIAAICGINVFVVLTLGLVTSILMGTGHGDYQLAGLGQDIYAGFGQMQEIFILSMLIGGLSELMRQQGGLAYLVARLRRVALRFSSREGVGHKLAIAGLASLTNLCVANNTVAIIVSGDAAKSLAQHGGISPKQSASLLDIFSCVVQGLLPYGAQALLLGASFGISPFSVAGQSFYCMALALVSVMLILTQLWAKQPAKQLAN